MSRHHPDLVMCRKQPGIAIGRLCDKCDGKCPVCDSYVRPTTLVRICDECSFGNYQNKCVVCGGEGISDAFYCFECTRLEKDRDGCPKIINLGSSRTDLFYRKSQERFFSSIILTQCRKEELSKSVVGMLLSRASKHGRPDVNRAYHGILIERSWCQLRYSCLAIWTER
jgi:PHD finger-like domain-containing protein 5A